MFNLSPPLQPRNGCMLEILTVCRVSNPAPGKQDIRSLDDQDAAHRIWITARTDLAFKVTLLAGKGSGEWLEREEYKRLIELIESNRFDLVLCEDLGRIVRRIHAHLICELCVDHGTRLIAVNDVVDTAQEGWEDRSIFSAWHHERSNRDTSNRIKRTHRNRFDHGGCLSLPIFGYTKKPGAKSDNDLVKLPEAEAIYKEWFARLDSGSLYSEIADWLNAAGVDTGPYARKPTWDGTMVGRVTHNIMLKGYRFRNKRKTRRNNETGKYKSEKAAPGELALRRVPHLAVFDEAYYDRIVAEADERNAKYRRDDGTGQDCRKEVPKKRTRFPGQSMYCGVCGRLFVFGGHGQTDHLECSGARDYKCWNGITAEGPLTAEKISHLVFGEIANLPDFDLEFRAMVNEEAKKLDSIADARLRDIDAQLSRTEREISHVLEFVRGGDSSVSVRAELRRLEDQQKSLVVQRQELNGRPAQAILIPSADEIREIAARAFGGLAMDSFEFAKLLRRLTGPIYLLPFRLCAGRAVVLRATFDLRLGNLIGDARVREAVHEPLMRTHVVDLFNPPEPVAHREEVMRRRQTATQREVAQALNITVTAAQNAAALDRIMKGQGLSDPYLRVVEAPADTRLRRHLHPRYKFDPLPGFPLQ